MGAGPPLEEQEQRVKNSRKTIAPLFLEPNTTKLFVRAWRTPAAPQGEHDERFHSLPLLAHAHHRPGSFSGRPTAHRAQPQYGINRVKIASIINV